MASVLPVLLLCLFFQCVATSTYELCMLENATYGGNFSLSVDPEYYQPHMNYTVTIWGLKTEMMVAMSASSGGNATGVWKNKADNCTGYTASTNQRVSAIWTATWNSTDYVIFKAYVSMYGNMSYVMNKTIRAASTTNPATTVPKTSTMQMTTQHITANINSTAATVNPTTVIPTATVNPTTAFNYTATVKITTALNYTATVKITTATVKITTAVKPTGGAITFKPLGGFAGMLLLFVAVRESLL